jgi:hypothetical protein
MASLVDAQPLVSKRPLLLYVSSVADTGRFAIGPALAAAAERAGWSFECYYDALRKGRHFGGGPTEDARPGRAAGSLVAGGRHEDLLLWLTTAYEVVAVGDAYSVLWPALDVAGTEALVRSSDPVAIYKAAFDRLGDALPHRALLLDGSPQGKHAVIVAPYLYPAFFAGAPALGLELTTHAEAKTELGQLGVTAFEEVGADVGDASYAELTGELADQHAGWGRGILLGDPELVAAQLPKAARLRLLPLYGRPQVDVVAGSAEQIRAAREPVYGRQYDDRDFFELARLGHGLQVLDAEPPFDAAHAVPLSLPAPQAELEVGDAQLAAWADEGRVLITLLFWAGMIRELDCIPRLIDLVAETELAGGLLLTAETIEQGAGFSLDLLATPPSRGGVLGLLEPLLASTGRGVGAEALLPAGKLETMLTEARSAVAARLPEALVPRGWWSLLDTGFVPGRSSRPVGWRSGRPAIRFTPRGATTPVTSADDSERAGRDVRGLAGSAVRRLGLDSWFEERRPYDHVRPGRLETGVAEAVQSAGLSYMWSKAQFGRPRVVHRSGNFVALSLTAGNWDGWSPFYTVSAPGDLARSERRLLRDGPGWLAGTIDSPLWALSGEILERGSFLYEIAELAAAGGRSGRLVNVTPNVVARYARLLDDRGLLSDTSRNRSR